MADVAPGSPAEWEAIIGTFLRDHVRRADAGGVVLGLSGGLDSAVVAALAVRTFGTAGVTCVLMPAADSDPQDEEDARAVAAHLGIETVRRPIGTIVAGAVAALAGTPDARMLANVKARARMLVLYAEAVQRNRLVAGTGNKSELLVGYFTKYGDGGVDVQPIGDLYKTQVFELARWLEVPERIRAKAPSAGLWPGQTDEDELGIRYEELDVILKGIELNASVPEVARRTGLSLEQVARVETMVRRSEHKRRPPLVPKLGARTIGIDWRRPVHWDA